MKRQKITKIIVALVLFTLILIGANSVNAAEELPDNGAKISSAQIIQTKTGTGPFDDNDEPGNDSSEDNNIVRSFDQVTWTVENTMVLNGDTSTSYTGGRIYFEATLPEEVKGKVVWKTDVINWIEGISLSQDKSKISGYYSLSKDETTIPGKQSLFFAVDVLDAVNGTEFAPELKFWLNGNEEKDYVNVAPEKSIVSAYPRYNIKLARNSDCFERTQKDYGSGSIYGRLYGYAFTLQLYNSNASKGLKGIEFPHEDITFNINLKLERTAFNSTAREDITNNNVILWNYKVNANTNSGNISNRSMATSNILGRYAGGAAPLGIATQDRKNSVYNSGTITMVPDGNKISVTISNYAIDGKFPSYNSSYNAATAVSYGGNVGCFSAGYFQIFIPDTEDTTVENRNYYLTISDTDFSATSLSGIKVNNQVLTNDDANTVTHVRYSAGGFSSLIYLFHPNSTSMLASLFTRGDSHACKGYNFNANSYISIGMNNDRDDYIRTVDRLFKFDADGFELLNPDKNNLYSVSSYAQTMSFNAYYVTKKRWYKLEKSK